MWAGDPADGERAVQPLRELATPLVDLSGPRMYLEFQRSLDPFFPAGRRYYWKALYLDGLADDAIETTVGWSRRRPSNDTLVIIRHCGGAISRVGAEETAFGDRSAEWMLSIDSTWHDPAADATNIAYTRAFWEGAARFSNGQTYFNFPGLLEEGDAAVRSSYGANHARLARIKGAYDPENRFRLNQNEGRDRRHRPEDGRAGCQAPDDRQGGAGRRGAGRDDRVSSWRDAVQPVLRGLTSSA